MRHIGVIVISAIIGLIVPTRTALPPGPSRLNLQAKLETSTKADPLTTVRTYALFNRPTYRTRIGTGVSVCVVATKLWEVCRIYARLGHGTIIGDTLVPRASTFFTFAVVGGTGIYTNTGGTITIQPLGDNFYLVIGTLEGLS